MTDPDLRLQALTRILKERGHRLPPQHMAVLKILALRDGHPSIEQIYNQIKVYFPMTSLGTIYKTVSLLKKMGEVLKLGFSDEGNRYDGNKPYPHPHQVCIRCKRIVDPDTPGLGDLPQEVGNSTGYTIVSHRLEFYWICAQCQR